MQTATNGGWLRTATLWRSTVILLALSLWLGGAYATAAQPVGLKSQTELAAFMDGIINTQLKAYHIPGATVAVVKDGQVFFAKGYGYADVENKIPVDPSRTLFRIGSATKLFTWTAVMQLVEQGKLDLNADINKYLDGFTVPKTYTQPITMANLMSHTAGFEDNLVGVFAHTADNLLPLKELLSKSMPGRVYPPGEVPAYSNYGVALAGYAVSQVAETSWEDYLEQNILQPLGMARTTVRQPVPESLSKDVALGYEYRGGQYVARGFEYIPLAPAGVISATATDMAKFMITHLQNGKANSNTRVLQESTAKEMHRQHYTGLDGISGMAHGFIETFSGGQRLIGHGGDTLLFHTGLELLPEHNVGIFVSYNSADGSIARDELIHAFIDRYFSVPTSVGNQDSFASVDATKPDPAWSGTYLNARTGFHNLSKVVNLFTAVPVKLNKDGRSFTSRGMYGEPITAVLAGPSIYNSTNGNYTMGFRTDEQGRVLLLLGGMMAFQKAAWYQQPSLHLLIFVGCAVVFATVVVRALKSGWKLLRRRGTRNAISLTQSVVGGVAIGVSGFYALFVLILLITATNFNQLVYGVSPLFKTGLVSAILGVVLTVALVVAAAMVWQKKYWTFFGRIQYTVVTMASVLFAWWLNYWNLLGFRY